MARKEHVNKKSHESFIQEIFNLVGNEYTILNKYENSSSKINVRHNTCGYEFERVASTLTRSVTCPKCNGWVHPSHEEFLKEVYGLVGNEYQVLSEFKSNYKKVLMKHNSCGNEYEVMPYRFLQGGRCRKCRVKEGKSTKKITNEEFIRRVKELTGDEYQFLEAYQTLATKIKVKHNECGYVYEVKPNNFFNGNRCPLCAGLIKKTKEQFKQEVYELVGNEYEIIGEYKNLKDKIKMKHNKCGYEYDVAPTKFLSGRRCPECANKMRNEKNRKTHEEFLKQVADLVGDQYTVLGKYINTQTKIKMKHNECGCEYDVAPDKFLVGRRCPDCFLSKKKTQEEFEKEINDLYDNEYTVLEEYKSTNEQIKIKHCCGFEYDVYPTNLLRGKSNCPFCNPNTRFIKNEELFKKQVYQLVGDEYSVIGEFKGNKIKVKMKHHKCDHEYNVHPYKFLSGRRCPRCNASHGELAIGKWLRDNKMKYKHQFKINECKNQRPLPFDFAVFKEDGTYILIEYQGEQHFKSVDIFGGEEAFKERQINDQIKEVFCQQNNIFLLKINYNDFDQIEEILNKTLLPLNLMKQKNKKVNHTQLTLAL